jgi:hypothetical protein
LFGLEAADAEQCGQAIDFEQILFAWRRSCPQPLMAAKAGATAPKLHVYRAKKHQK